MSFPYGTASLVLLLVAILSGAAIVASESGSAGKQRPDLIFATFTKEHAAAYRPAMDQFEKEHGVHIMLQVVDQRALQSRLQASLQVGAEVPDMVELLDGSMGIFTKGPIEDVGFVDLTQRVRNEGLFEKLVSSRFTKWSNRGHVFALPHDVHPVMLAYRRDLLEQLGIDATKLTTWEEFCRVGHEVVTKDLDGDGIPDRYMIDLPADGRDSVRLLLLQRGAAMFSPNGDIAFDDPRVADVIYWYIKQVSGKDRIAFPCGWGQTLSKAMADGLCLFYLCPDWRTRQFQIDVPSLDGKMGLIPLPAWEPGGRRTSTWGGTGLAITKQCQKKDLAWKLAMDLYYDESQLGQRFAATHVLPPLKAAWKNAEFNEPNSYYSNMHLGRAYADLAPEVPEEQSSAYMSLATDQLSEVYSSSQTYFESHGEAGLKQFIADELHRAAARVREIMHRNVFLREDQSVAAAGGNKP